MARSKILRKIVLLSNFSMKIYVYFFANSTKITIQRKYVECKVVDIHLKPEDACLPLGLTASFPPKGSILDHAPPSLAARDTMAGTPTMIRLKSN